MFQIGYPLLVIPYLLLLEAAHQTQLREQAVVQWKPAAPLQFSWPRRRCRGSVIGFGLMYTTPSIFYDQRSLTFVQKGKSVAQTSVSDTMT